METRWGAGRAALVQACAVVVVAAAVLGGSERASASERRSVRAADVRGSGGVTIDGRLDDAAWRRVSTHGRFVERWPAEGRSAPVPTTFRVAYDDDALYVGVHCGIATGEVPRGLELRRDGGRMGDDDAIVVKLDVRHDRRTTMAFQVNVAGAQLDYLATENGATQRFEVDAIWDSATTQSASGWTVEMRIPFAALGLAPAERERVLGLNVTRLHHARAATYDWSPMPQAAGGLSAAHYGELRGLRGVGAARSIALSPHVRIGWAHRRPGPPSSPGGVIGGGDPWSASAGLDVSARLADDTWAEATVLGDFSDADLDASVVNLGRFPLFRPERRTFFLTGVEVFDFGFEGEAQPFFSRRIGLDDEGRPIPVLAGAKLHGRTGPLSFGVLSATTMDPVEHFLVARARLAATDALRVGGIAVARLDPAASQPHVAAGADFAVDAAASRLSVQGFAAATHPSERSASEGFASGFSARWRGALSPSLSVLWVDDDFDPETGFVRRTGAMRTRASIPWTTTPSGGALESLTLSASGSIETSHTLDRRLGRSAGLNLEATTRAGVAAGAYLGVEQEWVDEGFEPLPGATVEPGTYGGVYAALGVGLSSRLPVGGKLVYELSTAFYGGTLHTVRSELSTALGPHLRATTAATLGYALLPQHDAAWTWTADATVSLVPSTVVTADVVVRANGVDAQGVGMLRVRWRWAAGSDLLALYRVGFAWDDEHAVERALTLSWTYRFDVPTSLGSPAGSGSG
ncbi:MAG: carbohydrate binding family 9 domain-containing protein [Deltaproteobacteria bacterium]|nr:carbohydrate binding family 9 domain-containing protein [Deltaproteobacteria bacterium]